MDTDRGESLSGSVLHGETSLSFTEQKERRLFYRTKLDLKIPSKDNPGGYLPLYRIPPGEYTELNGQGQR